MTAQGEHHLLHIGRAVGTSQKTDERPWRSQPEAAWSRWVVPASCVSNVIRAVLAPVLVLDFAPTRRRSRQSQRGEGTLFPRVCFALAQSTSVFILAFPFATSLFSLSIAPVRRFITPLRCGPNSTHALSFFLLLSSVTRCFGQFRHTAHSFRLSTPSCSIQQLHPCIFPNPTL